MGDLLYPLWESSVHSAPEEEDKVTGPVTSMFGTSHGTGSREGVSSLEDSTVSTRARLPGQVLLRLAPSLCWEVISNFL